MRATSRTTILRVSEVKEMNNDSQRIQTIVIGGGQAGLAVGYHLAKRRLPFLILDANQRVGDAWRNRWDSLRLFNPARYAGLPGLAFPARGDSFPTKDQMADTWPTMRSVSCCRYEMESRSIGFGRKAIGS